MALFDNISYGVSPQFTTSPDLVKMDFFSSLPNIGGMISSSSNGVSKGSQGDEEYDPMLYSQQVQTARVKKEIDMRKQKFESFFLGKAKELAKTKGITVTQAMVSMGQEIEDYTKQLQNDEIAHKANVELHYRNLKRAVEDSKDDEKKKQFTLLQYDDGREGFVGVDKNGKVTTDENRIVKPMTNELYYQRLGENGFNYGEVYKSPVKIDDKAGDAFLRAAMGATKSVMTGRDTQIENFVSAPEAAKFKAEFDKVATATTTNSHYNNGLAVTNEMAYLSRFLPKESLRAIKAEYLEARTNPRTEYKLREFNSKGQETGFKWMKLQDLDFNKGFGVYLQDKIYSMEGSNYNIHSNSYKRTFELYGDSESGVGFGGLKGVTNWWDNVAKNKMIGGATVLFNNPNAVNNTYVKSTMDGMKAWNESRASAMRRMNKSEEEINNVLNSAENIQQFEANRAKQGKVVPRFNTIDKNTVQSEIDKNGFGGIFTKGTEQTVGPGGTPKSWLKQKYYAKTTFPMSEQQLNRNYGAEVVKYDVQGNEVAFGLAGTGAELSNDVFGEGMTKLNPAIKKNATVLETTTIYQGVDRGDGRRYNSNALARQVILVPKEDAENYATAKLYANGRFGEYNYMKDNFTKSVLEVRKLNSEELKIAQEQAKSNGNTNGAIKLKKAMDSPDDYVAIVVYQDFQESAQSLAAQQSQKKPLYPDNKDADNGSKHLD